MIHFVPLHQEALPQVLQWRTDPEITRFMCTDVDRDAEAQRKWFEAITEDPGCEHWLIRMDERNVGLAYLTDIDRASRHCSCGFYIGEKDAQRFGAVVLAGIVNHVFETLGFHKIFGEVMAGNGNVLRMHDTLGYRSVGVLKDHVFKGGAFHDLHLFELLRHQWENKAAFYRSFRIPLLDDEAGSP